MGIKHRGSKLRGRVGKSSRYRDRTQTRKQSDKSKTDRQFWRTIRREKELAFKAMMRINRGLYGERPPNCSECGAVPAMHSGRSGYFWRCSVGCDVQVGCHPGRTIPLGTMADRPTRRARERAHDTFDRLWTTGRISRTEAYRLLSVSMGLPTKKTHFGMFTAGQCEEACAFARITLREIYRITGVNDES